MGAAVGLSFSAKKSALMGFGERADTVAADLKIQGEQVPWVSQYRYLGIHIQEAQNYLEEYKTRLQSKSRRSKGISTARALWGYNRFEISRSCDVIHLEVAAAWGTNGWALVQDVSLLMQPADSEPDEQSGGFQPQKGYLTGSQETRSQESLKKAAAAEDAVLQPPSQPQAIPEQQQPQQPAPRTSHSPFQVSPPLHGRSPSQPGPSQPSPPHTHLPSVPLKQKPHQKIPRPPETPQHSGECASWSPNQRLSENGHLFDASQGTVSPHPHHSAELIDSVFPEKNKNKAEMAKMPSTSSLDRSDIVDFVVDDRTPEETKAIYNSWASNYEEDMSMQKYRAPNIMAHFINQELKIKKDAIILDVGCGTGLLGVQASAES
ncbi:hypothetical protein ISCGN_023638 [Ixodes scapularis]